MDENTAERLATRIFEKICAVCVDRNVDGSCNRLAEGTCTLLTKLPQAAEAILKVSSDRIDPYLETIRNDICLRCDLRNSDGTCAPRDTDECMLDTYLPLLVEVIEEHFQRPSRDLTPPFRSEMLASFRSNPSNGPVTFPAAAQTLSKGVGAAAQTMEMTSATTRVSDDGT